jgi:lysyl endopeptidase
MIKADQNSTTLDLQANSRVFFIVMAIGIHVASAQSQLPFAKDIKSYNGQLTHFLSVDVLTRKVNQSGDPENIAGYVFQTDFTLANSGEWKKFSDKYQTWILKLKVDGAAGVSVVFSHLRLSAGAKLYVYNLHDIKGPFQQNNIPNSEILALEYLLGDELVIELDVPPGNTSDNFSADVSFTNNNSLASSSSLSKSRKQTGSCYTCFTGNFWQNTKRSVVKIITFRENEAITCTGTLVNNIFQNARPYILTAQHCISDQTDADQSIFIFGDEDVNCDGNALLQRSALSGCALRASSYESDFALVELYDHVPLGSRPYFAGWDITDANVDHANTIHHPLGGVKKISVQHQKVETTDFLETGKALRLKNSFWHVKHWDAGFTQGGSSGAPLFNGDQRIIGTLTGGESTCEFPDDDYFEKLSVAWNHSGDETRQLQRWLDPLLSGQKILDGFDPFDNASVSCDTLSNIHSDETTTLVRDTSGVGFLSGCNADKVSSYAESFENRNGKLTGIQFYVGSLNQDAPGGVYFSVAQSESGLPGDIIQQAYVPFKELHLYFNYVEFYPYITTPRKFFVTYTLDCSNNNSFALEMAQRKTSDVNTAYALVDSTWLPMSALNKEQLSTSLYIEPIVCDLLTTVDERQRITLYPNPASSSLVIKLPGSENEIVKIEIVGLDGSTQSPVFNLYFDSIVVDTSLLSSSVYLVCVVTRNKTFFSRFIKR